MNTAEELLEPAAMRSLVLVAIVVGGCSYNPGSFSYPARRFPGQHVTVGCLDISIDRRADLNDAAVLEYQFGNRCDKSVLIDLVRVNVVGRTLEGDEMKLEPFDPGLEMITMKIAGRQAGGEAIAYPTTVQLAQVCVDAASISDFEDTKWLCFATRDDVSLRDDDADKAVTR